MKLVQIKSGRAELPKKIFIIPQTFGFRRALDLICVFLRGGALRYRMGNSPQAGTFWGLLLIHNLLEAVIRTMKAEEKERKRD